MEEKRQSQYNRYVAYLYRSGKNYDTIGRYLKYTFDFMENAEVVSRRGYLAYRRKNAAELSRHPVASEAICDMLSFLKIGYRKAKETVTPLDVKTQISEKNQKTVNEFVAYLQENNDYSVHTVDIYRTSLEQFFSYAQDLNMDSCRRFIRTLEDKGFAPSTIRLRITALERFSKFIKAPLELKRPKMKRSLCVENVPTEAEYNKLLEYLRTLPNRDYYFWVKTLATTGARVSEFLQFRWEDIIAGEVTLKGKGSKYRKFFFQKALRQEVSEYLGKSHKSGPLAVSRLGMVISKRGLSERLWNWGEHCGIAKEKMHPHAFRHFFAKMFLKKNKDIVQLADLLGHGNIEITRIYLQRSNDEQKRDFNRNVTW